MKRIVLLGLIACVPLVARAQDTINPYNIQQAATIELHGKMNVYYKPYMPPAPDEPRDSLCSMGHVIYDSDGIFTGWPYYQPWVRGEGEAHDTVLMNWKPYGTPLGYGVPWQRFFTARRKADETPSDIIAGGDSTDSIIVSKNEDVDFRASGTVKLKNGFHAMPGCFFHAYQEPQYDSLVLSDNFDSINHDKWYIANGDGDGYGTLAQCSSDTNVADTADPEAINGHALDIFMYEDTCQCQILDYEENDSCNGRAANPAKNPPQNSLFTSAIVRACPFPYLRRDTLPLVPAYQQAPYGKYEIREKISHTPHHTNNWLSTEVDINESAPPNLNYLFPNIHSSAIYGPFKGVFRHAWNGLDTTYGPMDSVIFISHDANWSDVNAPHDLFINNFAYETSLDWNLGHHHDTIRMDPRGFGWMGWPASLANDTTDSITFYYARYGSNQADTATWHVRQDSHGTWRIFSASYHDSAGTLLRFSKTYQPTSVTLTTAFRVKKTFHCHWEYDLNHPTDSGLIYLDDTLLPSDLDSGTEAYTYTVDEDGSASPLPAFPFDLYDTAGDYKYHTFAVEVLPYELRYLVDSNVVCRLPDRLISPNHQKYRFFISQVPPDLRIGEFDLDGSDPFGLDSTSITYQEKKYFEEHPHNPGFRDVTINGKTYHAAHDLIDYVRVWTVPSDVTIPKYPH